jgi:hypothetical protein
MLVSLIDSVPTSCTEDAEPPDWDGGRLSVALRFTVTCTTVGLSVG